MAFTDWTQQWPCHSKHFYCSRGWFVYCSLFLLSFLWFSSNFLLLGSLSFLQLFSFWTCSFLQASLNKSPLPLTLSVFSYLVLFIFSKLLCVISKLSPFPGAIAANWAINYIHLPSRFHQFTNSSIHRYSDMAAILDLLHSTAPNGTAGWLAIVASLTRQCPGTRDSGSTKNGQKRGQWGSREWFGTKRRRVGGGTLPINNSTGNS